MKTSIYKIYSLIAVFGALMGSCAEDLDIKGGILPSGEGDITVNLSIAEPKVEYVGTRAEDDPTIGKVIVYAFTSSNNFTTSEVIADNNGKINVKQVKNATKYEFVALPSNYSGYNTSVTPAENFNTDTANDFLWGVVETTNLSEESDNPVKLLHHYAKVTVETTGNVTDNGNTFTDIKFNVFNSSQNGAIGSANYEINSGNVIATTPTLKSGEGYGVNLPANSSSIFNNITGTGSTVYVFETPKNTAKIIIEGKYNGQLGYYPITFATRTDKTTPNGNGSENPGSKEYKALDILRNHHYKVCIEYVRAEGWETPEQAYAAEPDNRISVYVVDVNPDVNNIIACRDYALGVGLTLENEKEKVLLDDSSSVSSQAHNGDLTLSMVSTYKEGEKPTYEIKDEKGNNVTWLSLGTFSNGESQSIKISDSETQQGKLYTAPVILEANSAYTSRSAYIIITLGDLERKIKVTQSRFNYLVSVKVKLEGLDANGNTGTSYSVENYFEWIENDGLFGLNENQNREQSRIGLHFSAVPDGKTLKYTIDTEGALNGKVTSFGFGSSYSSTEGNFTVAQSGNSYVVTCTTPSQPTFGKATLNILLNDGQILSYEVFQTGWLHYLSSAFVSSYALEGSVDTGWYYYEVVKAGNTYMLDRNIGAKSNAAYKSTNSELSDNTDAIGGYFLVANTRFGNTTAQELEYVESNVTLVDDQSYGFNEGEGTVTQTTSKYSYKPSKGFHLPSQTQVEDETNWNIQPTNVSTKSGEQAIVATVATSGGFVSGNVVYIPHGGYYEGDTHKSDVYANIWTRSLHCYAQSFDSKYSKEFGYWYRYLNGYGTSLSSTTINNISQMRYGEGSSGIDPVANGMPLRYMPLRLVWEDGETTYTGGKGQTGPTREFTYKIYWPKSVFNQNSYIYVWSFGNESTSNQEWWPWGSSLNQRQEDNDYSDYFFSEYTTVNDYEDSSDSFNLKFRNNGSQQSDNSSGYVIKDSFEKDGNNLYVATVSVSGNNPTSIKRGYPTSSGDGNTGFKSGDVLTVYWYKNWGSVNYQYVKAWYADGTGDIIYGSDRTKYVDCCNYGSNGGWRDNYQNDNWYFIKIPIGKNCTSIGVRTSTGINESTDYYSQWTINYSDVTDMGNGQYEWLQSKVGWEYSKHP